MQKTFFKKIIPSMLIVAILATGFFSAFRVVVVNAEEDLKPTSVFSSNEDPTTRIIKEANSPLTDQEMRDFLNKRYSGAFPKETVDKMDRKRLKTSIEQNLRVEIKAERKKGNNNYSDSEIESRIEKILGSKKELASTSSVAVSDEFKTNMKRSGSITGCNMFWGFNPYKCLSTILASIAQAMLEIFGFFVWISGKLLNIATQRTVIEMGSSFQDSNGLGVVVKEAWKTIRDLSNIIIIFMLLMIGIGIILRQEKYGSKKLLGMLIAVAILINFSLFFTNVIIDTSNLLALQFYNKVKIKDAEIKEAKEKELVGPKVPQTKEWNGFSDSYMEAFGLSTWYSNTDYLDKDFSQTFTENNGSIKNIFIIGILGSIMFLIASFAFLAATFFLISRYVILIFLMIFSPIAFVGMILPATNKYTTQWVNMLLKNAFYAPVYFLLTWFVISIISSPAYQASLGLLGSEKFANLTASETFSSGSIDLVLSFIIVIFFIILSIILSQQMGIKGSDMVIKWGQSAQKWGQGMVGGLAMRPVRRFGTFAKAQGGKWAEQTQESDGGFAKSLRMIPFANRVMGAVGAEGRVETKKMEDKHKDLSTSNLENLLNSKFTLPLDKKAIRSILIDRKKGDISEVTKHFLELDNNKQKEMFLGMAPRNQVALEEHLRVLKNNDKTPEAVKSQIGNLLGEPAIGNKKEKKSRLDSYLSPEDKDKRNKSRKEVEGKKYEKSIEKIILNEEKSKKTEEIKKITEKARESGMSPVDLPFGIVNNENIIKLLTKKDILRVDIESKMSTDQYKEFVRNVEEFGVPEAKEQLRKSPAGRRVLDRLQEEKENIGNTEKTRDESSKLITENVETEFRNRNQK